jgi:hypothetical protein
MTLPPRERFSLLGPLSDGSNTPQMGIYRELRAAGITTRAAARLLHPPRHRHQQLPPVCGQEPNPLPGGPAPRPPAMSPPTPDPAASTPAWEDHPRPADTPTATTPSAPGLFIGVQGAGPGLSKSVWIPLRSRSLFDIAVYPCLVRGGEPVMDPQPVGVGPGIGCRIVQGERDP